MKCSMLSYHTTNPMKKLLHPAITVIVCIILFMLDRYTKYLALYYCVPRCTITPFLAFDLAFNRGISWGILNNGSISSFYLVTSVIIAVTSCIVWYARQRIQTGHHVWGELLVITGSISNIIDRFMHNGVIDFIEFSYHSWIWPVFNCADIFIVLGVILMFIPLMHES